MDMVPALLLWPLGPSLSRIVWKHFKEDFGHFRSGQPAAAPTLNPVVSPAAGQAIAEDGKALIKALGPARQRFSDKFKTHVEVMLRRVAMNRKLFLLGAVLGLVAASGLIVTLPALGIPATVLAAYSLRQAYANCRLSLQNLQAFRAGHSTSPVRANALAHALMLQSLEDSQGALTPMQAQTQAMQTFKPVSAMGLAGALITSAISLTESASSFVGGPGAWAARAVITALALWEIKQSANLDQAQEAAAREDAFTRDVSLAWEAFLKIPGRRGEYDAAWERAWGAQHGHQLGSPLGASGHRVPPPPATLGPLLRWTRETQRLGHLESWLAAAQAAPRTWADCVFMDLEAIDLTRSEGRLQSFMSGLGGASLGTLSTFS